MRLNFHPHEYLDERGNTQRFVTMIKNGFVMLETGFIALKAIAFNNGIAPSSALPADHSFVIPEH